MADEEPEKKEEKKRSWLQNVPTHIKVISIAINAFIFLTRDVSTNTIVVMIILTLVIWYLLGKDVVAETEILSPQEAYKLLKEDIQKRKDDGRIPMFTTIYIDNDSLKHHNALPDFYVFGMEYHNPLHNIEFKRGWVSAVGLTKGFVTIQDSHGRIAGDEIIPTKAVFPQFMKTMKKEGILSAFLRGGLR